MHPFRRIVLAGLFVAVAVWGRLPASAQTSSDSIQGATFTQVTRPVAQLTDRASINRLMNELIITPRIPRDSVSRIEVIDVTENGYGPDDLVVVYPSGETFNIRPGMVSDEVERIMSSWQLRSEFQYDGTNAPAEAFRPDTTQADTAQTDTVRTGPSTKQTAQYGIMADLLQTVQRNYGGDSLSVLLERTGNGFTVEMWNYDEQAMQYDPPDMGPPDTVQVRDLVYVVRSDSVVYDVVYINKTVEETKYIPREGPVSSAPTESDPPTGAATKRE